LNKFWVRETDPKIRKGDYMSNQDERVLGRISARELTQDEVEGVTGGFGTQTGCTFEPGFGKDGDTFEC